MKKFFKQNIIISLIWNLPIMFIFGLFLSRLKLDLLFYWLTLILIYWTFVLVSIKKWYREEQFDKLEKRIKELEDEFENRIYP